VQGEVAVPRREDSPPSPALVIVVSSTKSAGHFQAKLQHTDEVLVKNSRQPFLDAARVLVEKGYDPNVLLVMKHLGSEIIALRAPLGKAAKLTVEEGPHGPRFVAFRKDSDVESLTFDLYYSGQVGLAAAEYNLEKADLIEMIQGHRAGQMAGDGTDNYWCDCRWTLTELGKRASMALLERMMLRDPPLEIAEQDAEEEANDVATDCGGCDLEDPRLAIHRRILANLDERAERIYQKSVVPNVKKCTGRPRC
jgi:hypothetical protein